MGRQPREPGGVGLARELLLRGPRRVRPEQIRDENQAAAKYGDAVCEPAHAWVPPSRRVWQKKACAIWPCKTRRSDLFCQVAIARAHVSEASVNLNLARLERVTKAQRILGRHCASDRARASNEWQPCKPHDEGQCASTSVCLSSFRMADFGDYNSGYHIVDRYSSVSRFLLSTHCGNSRCML